MTTKISCKYALTPTEELREVILPILYSVQFVGWFMFVMGSVGNSIR